MAIVGVTASGKSQVALDVARAVDGVEIVSVDSMQVYRQMDIGTAKPSAEERSLVAHHGIDLVDAGDDFTVAEFKRVHDQAIADIAGRGAAALLVGGTGLYHRIVIDDLEPPGEFPDLRAELLADPDLDGLYRRLVELDPDAAQRIEANNRRRITRALEVTIGTGRPFSSFGPGLDTYPPSPVVQIGIRRPRDVIAARIEARVDAMIAAGLIDEVERLDRAGMSRTAAQALGYKELIGYLRGSIDKDDAIEQIVVRTRQFSVRQERWFRRDPRIRWIDVGDGPVDPVTEAVIDALTS